MLESIKRQVEYEMAQVADLRVYKVRLASDDGWRFFTAKSLIDARRKVPGHSVYCASHAELVMIACRALLSDETGEQPHLPINERRT